MGVDMTVVEQRKTADGWEPVGGLQTFDWRSYGVYGFLAGVRNYSAVPPISEPRGLPADYVLGEYDPLDDKWGHSWLSISELMNFNYEQTFEDRRVTREIAPGHFDGGVTAEPGGGAIMTYREFLGEGFFESLQKAADAGVDRIVFGFDC
jgi:hypothetical protein